MRSEQTPDWSRRRVKVAHSQWLPRWRDGDMACVGVEEEEGDMETGGRTALSITHLEQLERYQ